MLKRIAIVTAVAALLLAALAIALLLLVNPNDYKGEIIRLVAEQTGHTLVLRGPLKLSILPRISLDVSGVELGSAAGFGEQPLLAVEQARVGVQLWPLLHHRLEIGRIELTGLRLHLSKNAQGAGNWQSARDSARSAGASDAAPAAARGPPPPGPTAAPAGTPMATTIEAIVLRDAELSYDDAGSNSHWRIRKLNATIGALQSGKPLPLQLQATIDDGTDQRAAAVTLTATLNGAAHAPAFELDAVVINAALSDPELPRGGLAFTLTLPQLHYLSAQPALDIPAFSLTSQALQLSGSLSGSQLDTAPLLRGTLDLHPVDLRAWLGGLGIAAPATRDPRALTSAAAHVAFVMDEDGLNLKPLHLMLDGSQIDGDFILPKAAGQPPQLHLLVDRIDVDRYLSPANSVGGAATAAARKSSETSALPIASLRALKLRIALQVKAATLAGMQLQDLNAVLDAGGGIMALKPMQLQLYNGTFQGGINLDVRGEPAVLSAAATAAGVDVGALSNALYHSRRLSGRATLTTQLSAQGADLAAWLKSLSGRLDATVSDGALQGVDVEYAISQAVALIGQHTLSARTDSGQTPFSQLNVRNHFASGKMITETVNAQTTLLKITGQGSLGLADRNMDYHLAASLLQRPDAASPGGLANLAGATLPFTISGPVDRMSIRPDVEGLVKGRVQQQLQQKTRDLTKGLLDRLVH